MKPAKRLISLLLAALLLTALVPVPASAAAGEPPCFTILVNDAPEDMVVTLEFPEDANFAPVVLEKETRLWETCFRLHFVRVPLSWQYGMPEGTVAVVETGGETFSVPVPRKTGDDFNTLFTFDSASRTLTEGVPAHRTAKMRAFRIAVSVVGQLLLFVLFGYRTKKSWLIFLAALAVTSLYLHGYLLWNVTTLFRGDLTWEIIMFFLSEFFIFVLEIIAFGSLMREHQERRAIPFTVVLNVYNIAAVMAFLAVLPM